LFGGLNEVCVWRFVRDVRSVGCGGGMRSCRMGVRCGGGRWRVGAPPPDTNHPTHHPPVLGVVLYPFLRIRTQVVACAWERFVFSCVNRFGFGGGLLLVGMVGCGLIRFRLFWYGWDLLGFVLEFIGRVCYLSSGVAVAWP